MKKYILAIMLLLGNESYGMMSTENTEIDDDATYSKMHNLTTQFIELATSLKNSQSEFLMANGAKDGDTSLTLNGDMTSPENSTYKLTFTGIDFSGLNNYLQTIKDLQTEISGDDGSCIQKIKNFLPCCFHTNDQGAPIGNTLFTKIKQTFTLAQTNGNMYGIAGDAIINWQPSVGTVNEITIPLIPDYGKCSGALFFWKRGNVTLRLLNDPSTGGKILYYYQPKNSELGATVTIPFKGNIEDAYNARRAILKFVTSIKFAS